MTYKSEDFVPYYKELRQHALNLTRYRYDLAEDIVQNAYLQFDKNKNDIKVPLKNYLHQLIKWGNLNSNTLISGMKNKSLNVQSVDWNLINKDENAELFNAYGSYSFNNINSFINLKDIYAVIDTIKHKKEKKAVLMFMEGYGSVEISKELGTTIEGARAYAYRGRKKLKKMMID